ncbi:GIY-YIG nuclease family protein [Chitinophagaceae bacterium MMS25-I14]
MFFAYVIESIPFPGYFYKGHCKDIELRLKEHNSSKTKSNKHYAPFRIVYFEKFETITEAVLREKYWKTAAGRRYLQKFLPKAS